MRGRSSPLAERGLGFGQDAGTHPTDRLAAQARQRVCQEVSAEAPGQAELAIDDGGGEIERAIDVDLLVHRGSVRRVRRERRLRAFHRREDVARE
jgi:hypothetical protein